MREADVLRQALTDGIPSFSSGIEVDAMSVGLVAVVLLRSLTVRYR